MQEHTTSKTQELINSLNTLSNSIKALKKQIDTETEKQQQSDHILAKKIEIIIKQQEKMGEAILLLLELHQKHIPRIEKNTKDKPREQPQKRQLPPFQF